MFFVSNTKTIIVNILPALSSWFRSNSSAISSSPAFKLPRSPLAEEDGSPGGTALGGGSDLFGTGTVGGDFAGGIKPAFGGTAGEGVADADATLGLGLVTGNNSLGVAGILSGSGWAVSSLANRAAKSAYFFFQTSASWFSPSFGS
jgi:hypothetical protein